MITIYYMEQALLISHIFAGFVFSAEEVTALEQHVGGPCSVIAPVQAFLLKNLLQNYSFEQLKQVRYLLYFLTKLKFLIEIIKLQIFLNFVGD